jgi:hypothetical protein
MKIISVQDLIDELNQVQNKDAEIRVFSQDEPVEITMIDDGFDGVRVDLNIDEGQ